MLILSLPQSAGAERPPMGAFAVKESVLSWPGDLISPRGWLLCCLPCSCWFPVPPRGPSQAGAPARSNWAKIAAPALVVLQPGRGDRLAPRRVHQVRGEPIGLQQFHQPAGAVSGLERGRGARRQAADHLQDRLHPLGTFRFARTCPPWPITATWERLRCTSIPRSTDIAGLLSELEYHPKAKLTRLSRKGVRPPRPAPTVSALAQHTLTSAVGDGISRSGSAWRATFWLLDGSPRGLEESDSRGYRLNEDLWP
jgi:hypothetical protein